MKEYHQAWWIGFRELGDSSLQDPSRTTHIAHRRLYLRLGEGTVINNVSKAPPGVHQGENDLVPEPFASAQERLLPWRRGI